MKLQFAFYCEKKRHFVLFIHRTAQKSRFLCSTAHLLHKKITFLSKSLRYSVVALLLVLFHATGGEDGVFCLVDFLHFLCSGIFHLFA